MIDVTLIVDYGPANRQRLQEIVSVEAKSTVLEVLTARLAVRTFPRYGMDDFVEAIDGVENDFKNDRGWRFEVNGCPSNVPAERYLVKNGDFIKWSYAAGSCSS
jgi:hypothetical protein